MIQKQIRRSDGEWLSLIQECRNSGMSDSAWCREHNIPASTFYNRVSRLRKKACAIPPSQGRETDSPHQVVPLTIMEDTTGSFRDALPSSHPAISMTVGGCHIGIHNHADKETIRNTLLALQHLC